MNTENSDKNAIVVGRLFYDGECPLCCASARRVESILTRRRFQLYPLQSPEAAQLLGLGGHDLLREMRVLLVDGRNLGGADALMEIARRIWWAWPLWISSRVPGVLPLLRAVYRGLAARRHCVGGVCKIPRRHAWIRFRWRRGETITRAMDGRPKQNRGRRPPPRHAAFLEFP